MAETFCISRDEERFEFAEYATRAEAISAAPAELGLEDGEPFYTGRVVPVKVSDLVDGQDLVDMLGERAWDRGGDAAEAWLTGVSSEHVAALSERLHATIQTWLAEIGEEIRFYGVEDVECHEAGEDPDRCPTEDSAGRCIYERGHDGGCDTENK